MPTKKKSPMPKRGRGEDVKVEGSKLKKHRVEEKAAVAPAAKNEGAKAVKKVAVICPKCTKQIHGAQSAESKVIACPSCNRVYHRRCYAAEIGLSDEKRFASKKQRTNCVVCLSGKYKDFYLWPAKELSVSQRAEVPAEWSVIKRQSSKLVTELAAKFLRDGFVSFPLWTGAKEADAHAQLLKLKVKIEHHFKALQQSYDIKVMQAGMHGSSVPSLTTGYSNFRMRCPGRFEIIAPFITETVVPLVEESFVPQVMKLVLNTKRPKQMTSGCFLAVSGAEGQNRHTDGPCLSGTDDLFPYAVNCFIPLVDVTAANGTEFVPGSQLLGTEGVAKKKVNPSVPFGHALLFDYRVVHRGLPNNTSTDRPCVYSTYAQPWYTDIYNFGTDRYTSALEVNPSLRESRETRMARRNAVVLL